MREALETSQLKHMCELKHMAVAAKKVERIIARQYAADINIMWDGWCEVNRHVYIATAIAVRFKIKEQLRDDMTESFGNT